MESFIGTGGSGSDISLTGTGIGSSFVSRGPQQVLPKLTQPAQIGDYLECDVVLNYTTQFDSDVTDFPVEDGFSISDHCIRNPLISFKSSASSKWTARSSLRSSSMSH